MLVYGFWSVADLKFSDLDPNFHFSVDPDPNFHFYVDPVLNQAQELHL